MTTARLWLGAPWWRAEAFPSVGGVAETRPYSAFRTREPERQRFVDRAPETDFEVGRTSGIMTSAALIAAENLGHRV